MARSQSGGALASQLAGPELRHVILDSGVPVRRPLRCDRGFPGRRGMGLLAASRPSQTQGIWTP